MTDQQNPSEDLQKDVAKAFGLESTLHRLNRDPEPGSLVEFVEDRLLDDEAYARNAFRPHGPDWHEIWSGTVECGPGGEHIATFDSQLSRHIERHDPARVLREVAAKRAILELADEASSLDISVDIDRRVGSRDTAEEPYIGDLIIRQMATTYADHPDYREEWRP